jgi:hypothetical protein
MSAKQQGTGIVQGTYQFGEPLPRDGNTSRLSLRLDVVERRTSGLQRLHKTVEIMLVLL